MTDERFERELRAMLAARDPGLAPSRLAGSVRTRLSEDQRRARSSVPRWLARGAVALGAAGLMVAAAVVLVRPSSIGPGAVPSPSSAVVGPTPVAAGSGIAAPAGTPTVQLALLAAAVVGLLIAGARTRRKGSAVVSTLLIVGLVGSALGFSALEPLGRRSGAFGAGPVEQLPSGAYAVTGGGSFWVALTVTNVSPLALTLRGLDPGAPGEIFEGETGSPGPDFVGLGLLDQRFGPEGAMAFQPVELAPGASVDVILLGSSGDCALPSLQGWNGTSVNFVSVALQVEQLTVIKTATMPLDQEILVPVRGDCPSS
jgi:hypothetical protein